MAQALDTENAGAVLAAGFLQAIQSSTNKLTVKEYQEGKDPLENSIRWSIWLQDVTNQINQLEGKTDDQKAQLLINSISEELKTKYYSTELVTTETTPFKNAVKTLEGIICVSDPQREARDRYEMILSKGPLEDAHDFLTRLEEAAVLCNFTNKKEKIADTLMTKCLDRRFMEKSDSASWTHENFDDMKKWAKRSVDLKKRIKSRNDAFKETPTGNVNQINQQQPPQQQKCEKCDQFHGENQCRAFNKSCYSCGGKDHYGYAKACPNYQIQGQFGYQRPNYQQGQFNSQQNIRPNPSRFGYPNQTYGPYRPSRFVSPNQGIGPPRAPRFWNPNQGYGPPRNNYQNPGYGQRQPGYGNFNQGFGQPPRMGTPNRFSGPPRGFRGGFRGNGFRGGYNGNGRINQIEQYEDDGSYGNYDYGYENYQMDPNYGQEHYGQEYYGQSLEPSQNQTETSSQNHQKNESTQKNESQSQKPSQSSPNDTFERSFIRAVRGIDLEN